MKRNLSNIDRMGSSDTTSFFYKFLYPIYGKEFLYGNSYELFAEMIQQDFILSSEQWDIVLLEWEFKERILS